MNKTVFIGYMEEENIPKYLRQKLSSGGCAGIIVNTVGRAQLISNLLWETLPEEEGYEVLLFHAQFVMPHRAEKEKSLIERVGKKSTPQSREKLIVVGTQVLEQSLDLDFDVMITDLCPMDLLLQRIGRLQRHDGRMRPPDLKAVQCMVLQKADGTLNESSCMIYSKWLLLKTRELLPEKITFPTDIPTLVQDVYEKPDPEKLSGEWKTSWEEHSSLLGKQKNKAQGYLVHDPPKEKKMTRFPTTLSGWLDADVGHDPKAEAVVRDGDLSIEVLMMVRRKDGRIHFPEWQNNGGEVSVNDTPSQEEARKIARQRLRLPGRFCTDWKIDETIKELEIKSNYLAEWQKSSWLKGELFLLMDEEGKTNLCGTQMIYSKETGLMVIEQDTSGMEEN